MASVNREINEQNRRSWNHATVAHNSHKGDQASYYRGGGNKLYPEERELLGDIGGLRVVHLQCNAGQDSLSLAQLGAKVTGVDISDEAIAFAQRLSAESGVPAIFVRSDIYDWLEAVEPASFDLAFCSYGATNWLSDIGTWAKGIARLLAPGGRFVTVEFHPVLNMRDDTGWALKYPYFGGGEAQTWQEGIGDYVALSAQTETGYETGIENFENPEPVHEFAWPVSEVVTALIEAGLTLEVFREYPYTNGFKAVPDMVAHPAHDRAYTAPEGVAQIPMMYALASRKP